MKICLTIISTLFLFACTTPDKFFDKQYAYKKIVKDHTRSDKKYSGLSNIYQVSVTHMNQKVMSLKNQKMAYIQKWPSHKIEEASQKQEEELSKMTQFVVVFYTPEGKLNDLSKGANSIWRTYLQVDNQRFQGVVTVLADNFAHMRSLYPDVSRFSKVYKIEFPVTSAETERASDISFLLTSTLGTSNLKFK